MVGETGRIVIAGVVEVVAKVETIVIAAVQEVVALVMIVDMKAASCWLERRLMIVPFPLQYLVWMR